MSQSNKLNEQVGILFAILLDIVAFSPRPGWGTIYMDYVSF